MRVLRCISIFAFILFAFTKETEGQECKDAQDWCTTLGKAYCDRTVDMREFCLKTCDACLPPACNECKHNCTVHDDGTHECSCLEGWELLGDKTTCEDTDECSEDIDGCKPKEMCRNYNGSFECMDDICTSFHNKGFIRSYSFEGRCCKRTGGKCGQNLQNIAAGRIIGGKAAERGMWPWQALLRLRRELCGGSLINSEWIVSAAHCFESVSDISTGKYDVYLGVLDTNDLAIPTSQSRVIAQVITHEDYAFPKNDIALVRLNKPVVESDFVSPVCLPNGEIPAAGTKCFTTGFGVTAQGNTRASNTLQQVDVPIVNGDVCKKAYKGVRDINTDQMICAGYRKGGKDACQGDSGGPLVCQRCDSCDWYLVGVTSFGEGCATEEFYGVYANVENYERWIDSKIDAVKVEKKKCNPPQWGNWGKWGVCSKKCGTGGQTRIRLCSNGEAGLPGCLGNDIERRQCNSQTCVTDSWTDWTVCSKTCAKGQQTRERVCVTASCRKRTQSRDCNTEPCPSWRPWARWGSCSKECGGGERTRTRLCRNGEPGQRGCQGVKEQKRKCNEDPCAGWEEWSSWSSCTTSCGVGRQTATRSCLNGVIGRDCIGTRRRGRNCNTQRCAGTFGEWSRWSRCTKTCGGGVQTRTRSCPSDNCLADDFGSTTEDTRACEAPDCVGQWTAWSPWDVCSKSCGSGTRSRIRTCSGGSNCPGKATGTEICNTKRCVGTWSQWASFSECDVTCGNGRKVRTRTCQDGNNCPGQDTDEEVCTPRSCPIWSQWADWSPCSATCEGGQQNRERTCGQGREDDGLCPGDSTETRPCGEGLCEAQCSELCTEYAKWGYCATATEWIQNFCQRACCGKDVCKDTADYCSLGQTWRCGEDQYRYDCTASCRYCP